MAKPNAVRKTKLAGAERQQVLAVLLMRSTNGRLKRRRRALAALHRHRGDFAAAGAGRPITRQRSSGFEVERSTVRSAAATCGMAPATLFRQLRLGRLRVHTSVTKPLLTEANNIQRLQFALSHIQRDTMLFDDMLDAVHVDEKLFYITQPTRRFLLLQGEVAPVRRLRSRRYITRVVFLAAIACPWYDPTKTQFFDGKLGIWPYCNGSA
uniref:Transposase Tc1-like domain-containing protein n=1 Tax=Phytophthora ramorum TaxID=164328 RepID=H3GFX3_PHYRM